MARGRRRGQIESRGDGCYRIKVFTGYEQDEMGRLKRCYHSETIRGSKKEAERRLTMLLNELDRGTFIKETKETLNQYLDRWLAVAAKPRVSPSTYADYVWLLKTYVRPVLGKKRLAQVKPVDIQALYTAMLEKGLSARTVRYTHSVLRSAFGQAVRWQITAQNPAQHVDLPRNDHKEMKCLQPHQARHFLEVAQGSPYYALFVIAITTGMRPGEYLALRWEDVNLETGTISVRRSLVTRRTQRAQGDSEPWWHFKEPKTPKSRRTIKLPPGAVQVLKAHRAAQAEQRLAAGPAWQDLDLVFAGEHGQPLDRHNLVRRHFKHLLTMAGLPDNIRLYDLRHTCATLLLAAGENPKVTSERLGHASVTMTLGTYSHVLPDMQQGAAEKLQGMLWGSSNR